MIDSHDLGGAVQISGREAEGEVELVKDLSASTLALA